MKLIKMRSRRSHLIEGRSGGDRAGLRSSRNGSPSGQSSPPSASWEVGDDKAQSEESAGTSLRAGRVVAYRQAAVRPPAREQIERMQTDLANLSTLSARQDQVAARGAALVIAHAALVLAVTSLSGARDRRLRADFLRGVVLPALRASGLAHVEDLVEVALAYDGDLAGVAVGPGTRQ